MFQFFSFASDRHLFFRGHWVPFLQCALMFHDLRTWCDRASQSCDSHARLLNSFLRGQVETKTRGIRIYLPVKRQKTHQLFGSLFFFCDDLYRLDWSLVSQTVPRLQYIRTHKISDRKGAQIGNKGYPVIGHKRVSHELVDGLEARSGQGGKVISACVWDSVGLGKNDSSWTYWEVLLLEVDFVIHKMNILLVIK